MNVMFRIKNGIRFIPWMRYSRNLKYNINVFKRVATSEKADPLFLLLHIENKGEVFYNFKKVCSEREWRNRYGIFIKFAWVSGKDGSLCNFGGMRYFCREEAKRA